MQINLVLTQLEADTLRHADALSGKVDKVPNTLEALDELYGLIEVVFASHPLGAAIADIVSTKFASTGICPTFIIRDLFNTVS